MSTQRVHLSTQRPLAKLRPGERQLTALGLWQNGGPRASTHLSDRG